MCRCRGGWARPLLRSPAICMMGTCLMCKSMRHPCVQLGGWTDDGWMVVAPSTGHCHRTEHPRPNAVHSC
eukprot:187177-Chlamydomonas_euryale.AAC.5